MDTREYKHIFKEVLRQVSNLVNSGNIVLAATVVKDAFPYYDEQFFEELSNIVGAEPSKELSDLVIELYRR
jgi:hypothetical protein